MNTTEGNLREIGGNLEVIRGEIAQLRDDCPLVKNNPALIAVSKRQPFERIMTALEAGQRLYGENRMQEALDRWLPIKEAEEYNNISLHFIGALQSNKAEEAVAHFDCIHSLDRPSLAKALAKAMDKIGKRPHCFVQVDTGEESQKGGIMPHQLGSFLKNCQTQWQLPVTGLMCLPPAQENPVPHFAFLKKLADDYGLAQVSMGMSSDWREAIRMGATHIRLGTAVFGERDV